MDGVAGVLLNYGPLGVIVLVGGFFVRGLLATAQKRADEEHVENIRLNTLIQEKISDSQERVIETLVTATQAIQFSTLAIQQSFEFLKKIQYDRDLAAAVAKKDEEKNG